MTKYNLLSLIVDSIDVLSYTQWYYSNFNVNITYFFLENNSKWSNYDNHLHMKYH